MASKGSKRANSTPAAPAPKKPKASPQKKVQASPKKATAKKFVEAPPSVFAEIVTALESVEHLPERCREMLVAMVEPSLSTPKCERHAAQNLGVKMIEETLHEIKEKQVQAVEQAQKELSELEQSQESRAKKVSEAQADLTSKQDIEKSKQCARDEADKFVEEAGATLADAKAAEQKGDEPLAKLNAEKATLENISQEHVNAPMEANEGPHFSELEPHIHSLGLDESLAIALPSSCAKTKEQRGGFDDVVLEQLVKALADKIASLAKDIEVEVPKVAERRAAVESAQSALEAKTTAAKEAALELEAAIAARSESSTSLAKATEELEALAPSIQEATAKVEELKAVLNAFEAGPLATFKTHQEKAPLTEEAAPAGA